jgi:hypothetical protein
MTNWKLAGKFIGLVLEVAFIGALIWGGVMLAWWVAG